MNFADHKQIIVTPVYEDAEASSRLFKELATQFKQDVFVVAVDDGSVKQPVEIASLENAGSWWQRRFPMPAAIAIRSDFDAPTLRALAKRCRDARQSRRLLSILSDINALGTDWGD